MNHTFVICAYRESPYLEECIESLEHQTVPSDILMVTSTPCPYLTKMAEAHGIPLSVNPGKGGIADDWNYALSKAHTDLVTIAHQDDVYEPDFGFTARKQAEEYEKPLILFTDYGELRNDSKITTNPLLKVKRIMLKPLEFRSLASSRFVRRRILSLGSAICCPSVTYAKNHLPLPLFEEGFRSNLDWQAWEKLSRLEGDFIYCNKILMYHRIHADSETTAVITSDGGTGRTQEDYQMFCRFWPRWFARILVRVYAKGQASNKV